MAVTRSFFFARETGIGYEGTDAAGFVLGRYDGCMLVCRDFFYFDWLYLGLFDENVGIGFPGAEVGAVVFGQGGVGGDLIRCDA
jgi:hypothetical protein